MISVNKIILIGHIAADPEVRETTGGQLVANFPVATNRGYQSANGDKVTDYHKVVAWARLAEIVRQYAKKGDLVYVEGRLQNRSYELPDKTKRFATEIHLDIVSLLTPKGQSNPKRAVAEPEYDAALAGVGA